MHISVTSAAIISSRSHNKAFSAALNKPRPRGRPPLHRKTAEAESNSTTNLPTMTEIQKPVQQKCYDDAQDGLAPDLSPILPKRGAPPFPTPVPLPILKDHLEVEAAPRAVPPNPEVSLFGGDSAEPESADFDKMVLLNYGSTDGRLEDDEEQNSASEWSSQKGILPARKELKFKGDRKADEEAAAVQRILEEVCPSTSFRARSSSSGTANKEGDEESIALPSTRKRRPYKKRARGRPRKIQKELPDDLPSPQKTGRPRGRPRKNGADPVQRSERKSIEKKNHGRHNRGRPRRAASMIQDFLELYAKIDLADLEEVHARATTFVRMLIDEYAGTSKDIKASPSKEDRRSSSYEGVESAKAKHEPRSAPDGSDEEMDIHSPKNEEMDVSMNASAMDDEESGEEAGSSGEDMAELDEESNSDANDDVEDDVRVERRNSPRDVLPDSFIDAIPVIRGTALQPLPTTADSALR
ncbi:hypothetical protein Y032_0181g857 [Ancylostoma ceylanicum]|uniref:Uncharacterized protein n=1 Tax=Ancylostoma ceylanicum TaxID=53326 RepID=A0A016SSN3_9BILA|nr:hypothetical protein Y032_0181g857 [Ancylostoma ceylanicum]